MAPITRSVSGRVDSISKLAAETQRVSKKRIKLETESITPGRAKRLRNSKAVGTNEEGALIPKPSKSLKKTRKKKIILDFDDEEVAIIHGPFDIEAAKAHLISVDRRWEKLFQKIPCKVFENTEMHQNPFRDLCTSIIAQQISYLAARSVTNKFVSLFFNEAERKDRFPTPSQILALPGDQIATLRSAGLSNNKARFVIDLAGHFQDGRLNHELFKNGSDREISEKLQEVSGIGPWTCDMFKIFSLKRPDILPCGDLGIQKGMLKWFASHPSAIPSLRKDKAPLSLAPGTEEGEEEKIEGERDDEQNMVEPETFMTPIKASNTANLIADDVSSKFPECLQTGLTKSKLDVRYKTKAKVSKGAYMTPEEMRDLTKSWRPYRSVGTWYMWCFVD